MSDERTPTAEPVTASAMRNAIVAERFPGAPANVRAISIERLDAIIAAAKAEAAQRSDAEAERLRERLRMASERYHDASHIHVGRWPECPYEYCRDDRAALAGEPR